MGNEIINCSGNGLVNLGNSCYMNSSLQCLANCGEFVETINTILKNQKKITSENKEDQKLLEKEDLNLLKNLDEIFSYLTRNVIQTTNKPVKHELKNVLDILNKRTGKYKAKVKSDSPEFTIDLLTMLIEMKTKDQQPIMPSKKQLNNKAFVNESAYNNWSNFIKKTNSKFVDLFYGQTQSELKCINPLCKAEAQIKTRLIYEQFLLCAVTIPKIFSLTVYVVYNNKLQQVELRIDGKLLMFYLKCYVNDKIKNKMIFKDEIEDDNYTMTIAIITHANNNDNININIETKEDKYIYNPTQESQVKQIFVVYIHSNTKLFNDNDNNNEQQNASSYKYLFISKNPKDINEIPHLYIIPDNNIDINTFLQENNLDNIITSNDISNLLNDSNKQNHLTDKNNQIETMNIKNDESDNDSKKNEKLSVKDCLQFYCDNQRNMTKCKGCGSLNSAKIFLTKLPDYFMLYLKRFYQEGKKVKKNCVDISFEEKLDLLPYTNFTENLKHRTEYELIAINQHITKFQGISEHYNAKIKKQIKIKEQDQSQEKVLDKWFLCDDLNVTETQFNDNLEYPLILIYKKIKQKKQK